MGRFTGGMEAPTTTTTNPGVPIHAPREGDSTCQVTPSNRQVRPTRMPQLAVQQEMHKVPHGTLLHQKTSDG